jgi:hypothetical protein
MRQVKRTALAAIIGAAMAAVAAIPGPAMAVQFGVPPVSPPLQLGVPFPILPEQRPPHVTFGLLRVTLQVQPQCVVDLPEAEPIDDLRIACSPRIPWLANLTSQDDLTNDFVTLDFMPVGQAWAPRPTAAPNRPSARLNVDY